MAHQQNMETVEQRIEAHNQSVYGGKMPLQNKEVMRSMLEKEDKFWEWEARDYVYGQDEGHPPMGAEW